MASVTVANGGKRALSERERESTHVIDAANELGTQRIAPAHKVRVLRHPRLRTSSGFINLTRNSTSITDSTKGFD